MQFIDLKTQYKKIESDVNQRIQNVLNHGQFILGPEVRELEERLAKLIGVKHCVAVSSGTDALLLAMMALNIQPGDEVITTPFSFFATAEVIVLLGARPIFVDIDPVTYNIDTNQIEAAITDRTRLIMPVSLYGQCADMDAIQAIANRHGLPVVEDAAQSIGATYKGRQSCGLSTIGCTSFFPSKPLGCYGDGGACFTNDDDLAQTLRVLLHHGEDRRYNHTRIGINGRFDTLQAAVLLAKLDGFQNEIALRQQAAERYNQHLAGIPGCQTPVILEHNTSAYAQYTLNVDNRDALQAHLKEAGIPTAVHYPVPIHKQPIFQGNAETHPAAEHAAQHVISLPMHPYLQDSDQQTIAEAIKAGVTVTNAG